MKRIHLILALLVLLSFRVQVSSASAHPADLYMHSIYVMVAKDGISIEWDVKPGLLLVSSIWIEADVNADDIVTTQEAESWADSRISLFTAALDQSRLPLQVDRLQFPASRDAFQSGAESIRVYLSAPWPQHEDSSYELVLQNAMEEGTSLSWYYVRAQDGIKFQTPSQQDGQISLRIIEAAGQAQAQTVLHTEWDSSVPSLSRQPQALVTESGDQGGSGLSRFVPNEHNPPQQILLDLLRQIESSIPFYFFALGIALLLGALHALTPGHGKTVVAAYLIGSRGTLWHAIALGTLVTLTHTSSVFVLGIVTLLASQYILPTTILPLLEILSGLMIVALGVYLLHERFRSWRKAKLAASAKETSIQTDQHPAQPVPIEASQGKQPLARSEHHHPEYGHRHEHSDGHVHSHELPGSVTWRSLIALGVSGGLVPCPDAIALLLVAVAINRILLGLTLIVSFSLGLAAVLIVIGLLMVNSRRLFDRMRAFDRFIPVLPVVSALAVLLLGAALTVGAFARAKDELNMAGPGLMSGVRRETQMLYLAAGRDEVRGLFITGMDGRDPVLLSDVKDHVVEYALSPDHSKVSYIAQTVDLEHKLWLVNIESGERTILANCENAICSRPVWSPDGTRIVYEYTRMSGENVTGLATLWSADAATGESQPVFQESQLPGANPRWSPDGSWLSYATSKDIRLYQLETGEKHVIESTLIPAVDWSPDSKKILFGDVRPQDGQFIMQLFVYDLATRTTVQVDPNANYETLSAAWSPDGEWIAVVRRSLSAPNGDQIWVIRPDGSETRAFLDTPGIWHRNVTWSPDGKHLLYDRYRADAPESGSTMQIIEVATGKTMDLGFQGTNLRWVWP